MMTKGQKARKEIVDTASSLFYQAGYGVTSYQEVAQACNLQKTNIQYHFKHKPDLLAAVIDHRIDEIRLLLEGWSLACDTPYNCIEKFILMIEGNAENLSLYGCPMGTLTDELGKSDPAFQKEAQKMFDLYLRWLEARFRAIYPPKVAKEYAQQLMVMAQGASVLSHVYGDPKIVIKHAKIMKDWLATVCETPY